MDRSGMYTLTTDMRTGHRFVSSIESFVKKTEFTGSSNSPSKSSKKATVRHKLKPQRTRSPTHSSLNEEAIPWNQERSV